MMLLKVLALPQTGLVSQRLEEIRNELRRGGGTAEDIVLFAEALFGRAPDDFLRRSSKETLIDIATDASEIVARYLAGKTSASVNIKNPKKGSERGAYTSLFVTLVDRPFIIDSVAELLRARGIKHHVLLHPMLKTSGGTFLSLSYFELDRLDSEKELSSLKKAIEETLADVLTITSDFEPLVSKVRLARDWIKLLPPDPLEEDYERAEVAEFLQWLIDGGFVFLGYREWGIEKSGLAKRDVDLGLFQSKNAELRKQLDEVKHDAEYLESTKGNFLFTKLNTESSVHRRSRLDLVTIRTEMNNEPIIMSFLGLLTSKAVAQEATSIPLIKRKIESVLQQEGFLPNSHDFKELVSLISTVPKADLFQFDRAVVRQDILAMMALQRRNETKVILRDHSLKRFFSLSIFMPRDRFSSGALQRIQRFLKRTFQHFDPTFGYQVASNEDLLVALYFLIPNPARASLPAPIEEIERNISELSLSWEEKLDLLLSRERGREAGMELSGLYNEVFPDSYKASVSHRESLIDIQFLEQLSAENPLVLDLHVHPRVPGELILKIYKRGGQLTLSELLPFLENVGFDVLNETVTRLSRSRDSDVSWGAIHTLTVRPRGGAAIPDELVSSIVIPGLRSLILREAENDRLNGLLLEPGLTIREIALLRALGHHLWQLREAPSEGLVATALLASPRLARYLVNGFQIKFEPGTESVTSRHVKLSEIRERFAEELSKVSILAHDRALRAMFNLLEAILRTNFYKSDSLRIAYKIDCAKLARMPEPRPLFEIFVCAPAFEGVHLRGGRVARGGIRWSERHDDFRTEILGLMKTQQMKNAIIVPAGAKGGFVVKGTTRPSKEQVIACYKDYIRSLLEITDNLQGTNIIHPEGLVLHDGPDPYLVVAADKGTAAFSDIANEIAVQEFNFWLGDAFASGGSNGYNHKTYGITARGVWETTLRHFREMGHDIDREPFSVVGIGDMSGDVFGNGLILSDSAKLLAAFDHRHIFLDPTPDPKSSFAERKRLFNLPASSWMDYDRKLLSAGGGIFDRSLKEIKLSPEAMTALGTQQATVSGVELIRIILCAPVDLLWNGGIGTYVKASTEHNVAVGDRGNDEVRVDASALRAKIVSEGGNLGFTQRARIEYATHGGRINTDAVDNSGGVNLSDLEVNIKILLQQAVARGTLSFDARTKVLMEVADEVCLKVLDRNSLQSRAITGGVTRSKQYLSYYKGIIALFQREKLLDRKLDELPDDESLADRSKRKQGLCRPEMAILLACVKIWVSDIVVDSKLADDPALEDLLFDYFPRPLQERFAADIRTHPLRREIIATQVANILGERMGATFLYRLTEELGTSEEASISAFLAAKRILQVQRINDELQPYDRATTSKRFMSAIMRVNNAADNTTRWILRGGATGVKFGGIQEIVRTFEEEYHQLRKASPHFLPDSERKRFDDASTRYRACGFSPDVSDEVASLPYSTGLLDVIHIARARSVSSELVAQTYGQITTDLRISHLLELVGKVDSLEHWDVTAQRTLSSTIRHTPGLILRELFELPGENLSDQYKHFRMKHEKGFKHYLQHVKEVEGTPLSISALLVLSNQLIGFWREG